MYLHIFPLVQVVIVVAWVIFLIALAVDEYRNRNNK